MRNGIRSTLLAVAVVLAAGVGDAQPQPAPGAGTPAERAPAVDPEAIKALERMGKFLQSLKAFEVRAENTTDQVLDTGQKIQFGGVVHYRFRKPQQLRADVTTDRKHTQFFYDGKTLTLYRPRMAYYTTVPAPPTIRKTLEVAEQTYGLDVPLADLFFWGTDQSGVGDLKGATRIGPSKIGDVMCDQYAFRQEEVDWQLWIETGARPLPRKLVITTVQEPAQPQHVVVLTWNLSPKLDDTTFVFKPPATARRIPIRTVDDTAAASPK